MNEKHSLLDKIKSKYILKDVLSLAFKNMKSVLKFIAYNKVLLQKLDINIKEHFDYKIRNRVEKENAALFIFTICDVFFNFIPLMIYDIMFYAKGTFNDKNLEKGYDKKKKNYVDVMNNYILLIYLILILTYYILYILYNNSEKISLKKRQKIIIFIIVLFIEIMYFITHIIKYNFTGKIINKELKKKVKDFKPVKLVWFYNFDIAIIYLMSFNLFFYLIEILVLEARDDDFDDKKLYILRQINGFDICDINLPSEFDKLNDKDKIKIIFKKESMEKYEYKLDVAQLKLIDKINQLRRQNNIPEFQYNEKQKFPEHIINSKTELFFYEEKDIYKFSNNYYLIKYPISEYQNDIKDKNIINILAIDILDRINIMRKDNYEYISLYNNINRNNRRRNNTNKKNIKTNSRRIDLPQINIANTEDRLNEHEQTGNLSVTRVNVDESDNEGNENIIVRNINVNENHFEKK